jgi:hypothetical protein
MDGASTLRGNNDAKSSAHQSIILFENVPETSGIKYAGVDIPAIRVAAGPVRCEGRDLGWVIVQFPEIAMVTPAGLDISPT